MSEGGPETGGEEALIQARRDKARQVRERGENPFENDLDPGDRATLAALRARFESALVEPKIELRYDPQKIEALGGGDRVHVVGRLVARRGFGKASFFRLRDGTNEL